MRPVGFDVEQYVREMISDDIHRSHSTKGHGVQLVVDCSFCGKRRRMYVSKRDGAFICYSCSATGSLYELISVTEGIPVGAARSAVADAAKEKMAKSVRDLRARNRELASDPDSKLPGAALPMEYIPVWDGEERVWNLFPYLRERKIGLKTAARFQIGRCDEGPYAGYMILPATENGDVVTFTARAMKPWLKPKYRNPTDVGKTGFLYGIDNVEDDVAVLVEGPTDTIAMYQKGYRSTVASLGKTLSIGQIAKLRERGVRDLVIMYDAEEAFAPFAAAKVAMQMLNVYVARLPSEEVDGDDGARMLHHDPDTASPEMIEEAISSSFRPTLRDIRNSEAAQRKKMQAKRG